jgi:hypothetical protein
MLSYLKKYEGVLIGLLHVGDGQSSAASQYYSGLHFVARQYCRSELVRLDKVRAPLFKSRMYVPGHGAAISRMPF